VARRGLRWRELAQPAPRRPDLRAARCRQGPDRQQRADHRAVRAPRLGLGRPLAEAAAPRGPPRRL